MRKIVVHLCFFVLSVHNVQAQDRTRPATPAVPAVPAFQSDQSPVSHLAPVRQFSATPNPNIKAEQLFSVQFTEFRLKQSPEVNRTANEIVQSFDQLNKEGKVELIESIRLSALEHHESTAQFGKTTSVTTGVTRTAQGQQRSISNVPLGTLVQILATPQENKVLLKIAFTASRIEDIASEEKQPDIVTVNFNSTLLLEIGKATLVGGIASDTNHFLMITLSK